MFAIIVLDFANYRIGELEVFVPFDSKNDAEELLDRDLKKPAIEG